MKKKVLSSVCGFLLVGSVLATQAYIPEVSFAEEQGITSFEGVDENYLLRIEIQKEIPKLIDFLSKEYADTYSGLYVDKIDGSVVNIGFKTIPNDLDTAELNEILGNKAKVNIFEAKFSYDDLGNINDMITNSISKSDKNIVSINTSFENQQIMVGFSDDIEQARNTVLQTFGNQRSLNNEKIDEKLIKFVKKETLKPIVDRASIKVRPVAGGVQMNFDGVGFCTNGFSAKNAKGTKYYLVSAGHCSNGKQGTTVKQSYQKDNYVGFVVQNDLYWSTPSDSLVVEVPSTLATPYIYTSSGGATGYKIIGENVGDYEGMGVCTSLGEQDTQMCGVVTDTSATVYTKKPYNRIIKQKETNLRGIPGDSGSPVFTFIDDKNVAIYGIASTADNDGKVLNVTHIKYIKEEEHIVPLLGSYDK